LRRVRTTCSLDQIAPRTIAEADPDQVLAGAPPLLIDEWQRVPPVWDAVRRAVDRDRSPGRFLLTGSAGPLAPPTHSGAGRIVSIRMRPLALSERRMQTPTVSLRALVGGGSPDVTGRSDATLADYTREIVRSGFPGIRGYSGRALRAQLDSYVDHIVDRDFEEQGLKVRKPETLRRWMASYAAAVATCASYETIRDAATGGQGEKPARSTTEPYRAILERLWIVDPVPAWLPSCNHLTNLAQPPKHHLADPALAARILGLDVDALLGGEEAGPRIHAAKTLLGRLWESLVTLSLRVYAQAAEARVKHFRQRSGRHEVDLIVERADGKVLAIEVKLGGAVTDGDVRHLLWLRERIGSDLLDAVVVCTGPQAYRRKDGIAVVPAALLGA